MWFVDVIFMIMGCGAAENYVVRDPHLVKWLDCNMGMLPRIVSFQCKFEQPATKQCNGIKNSETEMCTWKFFKHNLEAYFLEDEYHKELGHQAVFSAEIIREQRNVEAENLLKL